MVTSSSVEPGNTDHLNIDYMIIGDLYCDYVYMFYKNSTYKQKEI